MPSSKGLFRGFAALSLLMMIMPAKATSAAAGSPMGVLANVEGDVSVDGKHAKNGSPLTEKSVVETKDGKCTLLIGEDIVVHLDKNSNISTASYAKGSAKKEEVNMNLKFGKLRALVATKKDQEKHFSIKTRTAVMGVRGTQIYIDSPADPQIPATFLTIEGKAELRTAAVQGGGISAGDAGPGKSDSGKSDKSDGGKGNAGDKNDTASKGDSGKKSGGGSKSADTSTGSGTGSAGSHGGSGGETIVLAANQMSNDSGASKPMEQQAVQQLANSVAPPPTPIQSANDLSGVTNNTPPPKQDTLGNHLPPPPQPIQPQIDPIANGQNAVPVHIVFTP